MGYALVCASLVAGLALVSGCGGSDTVSTLPLPTTLSTSAPTDATSGGGASAGDAVFASTCAGCHGADGTGASGPDLTSRGTLTMERIVDQVTNGGSSMPAYGSKLSSAEIDAVAEYVLGSIVK